MTNIELALNTLAEASTTEIKAARKQLESQLGRSIISPEKAKDYLPPHSENDE